MRYLKCVDKGLTKASKINIVFLDKKAACAAVGAFVKRREEATQLQCAIDCCTDDDCNTKFPSLSKGTLNFYVMV